MCFLLGTHVCIRYVSVLGRHVPHFCELVVIGVYVDDLLATGTSVAAVESFLLSLLSLSIKDLGHVNKF